MIKNFVFASLTAALVTALGVGGCSSSTTTLAATDAGTSSGDSGGTGEGGPIGDTGTTGALSCTAYCTSITANCTGANQQFSGMDQCMNSCKAFPVGTAADKSGNTLGCRTYHAGAAKADAATHCVHSGPGGAATCGDNCDGFCQIAMMYCTAANMAPVYATLADCKTACAAFPDTAKFNVTDTALQEQKQVGCLLYHVQEASAAPADHCNGDLAKDDAGHASTTCNK